MIVSRKKIKFGLLIVAVLGLLFFLHQIKVTKPVENIIVRLLSPVQRTLYRWADSISYYYIENKNKHQLEKEIEQLRTRVSADLIDKAKLAMLEEENRFLRQQLEFTKAENFNKITAYVISESHDETVNTILIDKGKNQGIAPGLAVIVDDGIIVGKIIKASDYNSVVLLLNDHNSRLAVSVLNNDKTIGLIRGEYGLGAKLELIPQTETIKEGELVVTSGVEDNIPRGLVVGMVDSVIGSEEAVFKEAIIRLPINFNKVFIVTALVPKNHVD